MALTLYIENEQVELAINESQLSPLVKRVLEVEEAQADELSIRLVTVSEMCAIHARFFDDPSVTDCISLPMDEATSAYRMLGDVIICPKVALDYCQEHGGEPYREVSLYLVHGILHLLGYNDLQEEERKEMRAAEARAMDSLSGAHLLLSAPK